MHYVKHFDILGVDTAQIPCVELQGVPNTATEGAVGLLGMNMLSEDHELYLCVAVNGNVYTWQSLKDGKDGVSIIKTELNDNCELIITFSNGTQTNLGVIRGEKGEKGEQADLTKFKEKNKGRYVSFWLGDIETFEKLESTEENTWYLFEDDTTLDEIEKALDELESKMVKVDELDTRTKAVEDIIPRIEDNISLVSNELHESMKFVQILCYKGTSNPYYYTDAVSKPSSLSYESFVKNYITKATKGSSIYDVQPDNLTFSIYDKDGSEFVTVVSFNASYNYWRLRNNTDVYYITFKASKTEYSSHAIEYTGLGIKVNNVWYCPVIIESEMD